MRLLLPCLLALPLLAGCQNTCQTLCENLADYADDCGTPYTDSELEACVSAWEEPSAVELQTCREFGTPDILRREWTCDDVNLYRGVGVREGIE